MLVEGCLEAHETNLFGHTRNGKTESGTLPERYKVKKPSPIMEPWNERLRLPTNRGRILPPPPSPSGLCFPDSQPSRSWDEAKEERGNVYCRSTFGLGQWFLHHLKT